MKHRGRSEATNSTPVTPHGGVFVLYSERARGTRTWYVLACASSLTLATMDACRADEWTPASCSKGATTCVQRVRRTGMQVAAREVTLTQVSGKRFHGTLGANCRRRRTAGASQSSTGWNLPSAQANQARVTLFFPQSRPGFHTFWVQSQGRVHQLFWRKTSTE